MAPASAVTISSTPVPARSRHATARSGSAGRRPTRWACGWRSIIEAVGGARDREKAAIYLKLAGTDDGWPAFLVRTEHGEARPMRNSSQFATAMLALVFTGALLVTGQLFIEQRAQRDVMHATNHLLRPL